MWSKFRRPAAAKAFLLILSFWWFGLPNPLFKAPYSTVLEDNSGALLSASIAPDGQWRFPAPDSVPYKFTRCLTAFEDRQFYRHIGINPVALAKAFFHNLQGGPKRGGSTLSMQVVRLARGNQKRNLFQKILEIALALRLEVGYSKAEILNLYAAHAPFGGNVVGLEAACWRWFGRPPTGISWAEAACLAVLPNSPSLIFPGKNQNKLLAKRNRLLKYLYCDGAFDKISLQLALAEALPQSPGPLPDAVPHLMARFKADGFAGQRRRSTLNIRLQQQVEGVTAEFATALQAASIRNAAVLVTSVNTGEVMAYIGNSEGLLNITAGGEAGGAATGRTAFVDISDAERSYGSLLKPFLFAEALDAGLITPEALLPDVPKIFGGYAPRNFSDSYEGAIPASSALARSLNLPFINLLQAYGPEKLLFSLQGAGITTLNKPASHYGLTLILGGGEAKLWEITGLYASMARKLKAETDTVIAGEIIHPPIYLERRAGEQSEGIKKPTNGIEPGLPTVAAIYSTFEALQESNRPDFDANWKNYAQSRPIAWKTGTSFGFRDAWCVGVSPDYVIAVWAGNADGEGRPGLTGIGVAAPLMFSVSRLLPQSTYFVAPPQGFEEATICTKSGFIAGPDCPDMKSVRLPLGCLKAPTCPYHKLLNTDLTGKFQLNSDCAGIGEMKQTPWFILPPALAWYYAKKNTYLPVPPFKAGCRNTETSTNFEIVYPNVGAKLRIPKQDGGGTGQVIFEAAANKAGTTLYWHLDGRFISVTNQFHQCGLRPQPGKHLLIVIDSEGEIKKVPFEVSGN